MAGFDCKCPYCDKEIPVYNEWVAHDHSTDFTIACEWCGRTVQIDVGMEPIFETSKPSCCMCNKAEPGDNGHYCNPCHQKLIELSKRNMDGRG